MILRNGTQRDRAQLVRSSLIRCDVRVVAIGVTRQIDYQELRLIASTDCDVHTVDYFDQMTSDMNATMNFICGCK